MADSVLTCFGSRFYADDNADHDACTALTSQEAGDGEQPLDRGTGTTNRFHLRIGLSNSSAAVCSTAVKLQYNLGGAGWNDVNGSSSVIQSTDSLDSDGDACATSLLTGGTGDFDADGGSLDEADGAAGSACAKSDYGEWQWCIYIVDNDVSDGNEITFQVVSTGDDTVNMDSIVPTVTVDKVALPTEQELAVAATLTPSLARSFSGARTVGIQPTLSPDIARSLSGARTIGIQPTLTPAVTRTWSAFRTLGVTATATVAISAAKKFFTTLAVAATAAVDLAKTSASYVRTLGVALTGTAAITRTLDLARTLGVTSTATATVTRVGTFARTLAVASTAAVDLSRAFISFVTLAVTSTAATALAKTSAAFKRTLGVTSTVSIAVTRTLSFLRTLGVASTQALLMDTTLSMKRTLAVASTAAVNLARILKFSQIIAVTSTAAISLAKSGATFFRTLGTALTTGLDLSSDVEAEEEDTNALQLWARGLVARLVRVRKPKVKPIKTKTEDDA